MYYGHGNCEGNKQRYYFDITELARKWANGKADVNKGVMFKTTDEYEASDVWQNSSGNAYRTFGSWNRASYWPSVIINYIDVSGVNSFYTYDSNSLGNSTVLRTGHRFGNLVAEYSFPVNGVFPESVRLVYNSTSNSWRLSLEETLERELKTYLYTDGTGAKHTFRYKSAGVFENTDLDAVITVSDTETSLSFSDGTEKIFNADGRIVSLCSDGETYTYNRNAAGQLTSVVKGTKTFVSVSYTAGTLTSVNGCAVSYGVSGKVSSVSDRYGNTLGVSYSTDAVMFTDSLTDTSFQYVFSTGKVTGIKYYYGTNLNDETEITYSESSTVYIKGSDETAYLFDLSGSTVNTVLSNADGIYSASQTSGTAGICGAGNGNMLANSIFHSLTGWQGGTSSTDCALLGDRSIKLVQNGSSSATVQLQAGDYVFSAYFNTLSSYGGLKLRVQNGGITDNRWYRTFVPFTAQSDGTYTVSLVNGNPGTAYADCVMLEKGTSPTTYNVLGEQTFTVGAGNTYSLSVPLYSPADRNIVFSGWLDDTAGDAEHVKARLTFNYSNGTSENADIPFTAFVRGRQIVSQTVTPATVNENLTLNSVTLKLVNGGSCSVTFSGLLLSFGDKAQEYSDACSANLNFTSFNNGTCKVYNKGTCTDRDIYIPTVSPAGDTVTAIGPAAFRGYTDIDSITVPDTVTTLGNYAFHGSSVKQVYFEGELTSIPYCAFYQCSQLTEVNIPDTVTSFGTSAFDGAKLVTLVLPEGFKTFGSYSVLGNSTLETVYIPSSVTAINKGAFNNCGAFDLYYGGSQTDWNNVSKGTNAVPSAVTMHYNCRYKDGSIYEKIYSGGTVIGTRVLIPGTDSVIQSYEYDVNGNITRVTDSEGYYETYSYDSNGNMVSFTSKQNRTTTYTYNSYGDVVTETLPNGTVTYYSYLANGLLSSASCSGVTVTYSYNSHAQILTVTETGTGYSRTYIYAYDARGNVASVTVDNPDY